MPLLLLGGIPGRAVSHEFSVDARLRDPHLDGRVADDHADDLREFHELETAAQAEPVRPRRSKGMLDAHCPAIYAATLTRRAALAPAGAGWVHGLHDRFDGGPVHRRRRKASVPGGRDGPHPWRHDRGTAPRSRSRRWCPSQHQRRRADPCWPILPSANVGSSLGNSGRRAQTPRRSNQGKLYVALKPSVASSAVAIDDRDAVDRPAAQEAQHGSTGIDTSTWSRGAGSASFGGRDNKASQSLHPVATTISAN